MYYQNGNYMQDLNYYNQNPNYNYSPYGNQFQNPTMNPQMPMGQMAQQNLNAMYPAIYRIISPVVAQVLAGTNCGYVTEDNLNKMVDTVYNIVEGDINLENNTTLSNTETTENPNSSNCARPSSNSSSSVNTASTTTARPNRQNTLLRDLIKIMILNEILCRRQNAQQSMMMQNNMPNNMPNGNMNQPMFL